MWNVHRAQSKEVRDVVCNWILRSKCQTWKTVTSDRPMRGPRCPGESFCQPQLSILLTTARREKEGSTMTTFGPLLDRTTLARSRSDNFWPALHHFWPRPLFLIKLFCDQTFTNLTPKNLGHWGLLFGICCSCLVCFFHGPPCAAQHLSARTPTPRPPVRDPPLCCVCCDVVWCIVVRSCGFMAAGALHDSSKAQTCACQGPGFRKHHQNSTKGPPREGRKKENCGWTRKKRNFVAPTLWVPTLRGPTYWGLHFCTSRKRPKSCLAKSGETWSGPI